MGSSSSKENASENKNAANGGVKPRTKKLLLLGTSESGKSTFFKQMIALFGEGFTPAYRRSLVNSIHHIAISSMQVLIKKSDELTSETQGATSIHDLESKQFVSELKADDPITYQVSQYLKLLWADPGIQHTYELRANFQLNDSAKYFFERLDDMALPEWVPSKQDVIRCYTPTTDTAEITFSCDARELKMLDVGGQRSQRQKWIPCFENVDAVLFVASMSEYDQVLAEDETTNRLTESLNLFEDICNNPLFSNTPILLLLNKRDLFEEKIKKVDLSVCLPDYTGGSDIEQASQCLMESFHSKAKGDRVIYTNFLCATDSDNALFVFNCLKDVIVQTRLGSTCRYD